MYTEHQHKTIQYNKLYLKSENIKHYNTSSNELLNPAYAYINNKTKTFTQYLLKKPKKTNIVILKFSMKFQTKLKYESNLKHSSSRSII